LFKDASHFKQEILKREERDFVSRYIFESIPYLFDQNIEIWIEWKTMLGRLIEVDPRDIVLTGSSAVGFSLNPTKNFRAFSSKSDVDCGIISAYHFDIAWRYLRQRRVEWLTLNSDIKSAIESHRKNLVFAGTIATDRVLALLPFGQSWSNALESMSMVEPTTGRDVRLRIYKDFDALRNYQAIGIRDAKGRIGETQVDHEELEIETEDS
jgi:hypothetical protein